MSYQQQLQAYLHRQHLRITVTVDQGSQRLLMLHPQATLNDLFKQLDSPKTTIWLYTPEGAPVPRTDEYAQHFLSRSQQKPWHRRPAVYALNCVTMALWSLPRELSEAPCQNVADGGGCVPCGGGGCLLPVPVPECPAADAAPAAAAADAAPAADCAEP